MPEQFDGIKRCILAMIYFFFLASCTCFAEFTRELEVIRADLAANPRNVQALNAYGILQAKTGDLAGAIKTWRAAIDINPQYIHLHNNIGSALLRLGYFRDSLAWYLAAIKIKPTYWTWFNIGLLYEEMGQKADALKAFKEALLLFPEFSQARENSLRLEREIQMKKSSPSLALNSSPENNQYIISSPLGSEKIRSNSVNYGNSNPRLNDNSVTPPNPMPIGYLLGPGRGDISEHSGESNILQARSQSFVSSGPKKSAETAVGRYGHLESLSSVTGVVFLTFDGGADADGLPKILSTLADNNCHSTFFLTGQFVKTYPDLSRKILEQGHEIANHSMNHQNMSGWNKERIANNLEEAELIFQKVLGRKAVPFFRFPFGAQNKRVEEIVMSLGYRPVYWTIDTLDWKEPSVASILSKVQARLKPSSVILMHCGSKSGSKALPIILDEILKRGFKPVVLTSLNSTEIAKLP